MQPLHDPISAVVYSAQAADVQTVLCAGKILMEDRRLMTIDEEKILRMAAAQGASLISRSRS
jgi:5-methylthioadenosine/S-adenosylhomocysteine deaminase